MKNIKKLFSLAALLAIVFTACQKVEDLAVHQRGVAPSLMISATTLTPKVEDSTKVALTLDWTYPNHATSPKNIKYTIEIDSVTKNFSSPLSKVVIEGLSTTFLNKDLNKFALGKRYEINKPLDLQVRVTSSYLNNNERIASNVMAFKYTPYRELINYEFPKALRVAGNFQNWDPATAPKIVDPAATGTTGSNYEGYINFNNANPEFKLVKGNNWGAGDFGSSGPGTIGGGDNFRLTNGAGVYLLKASTQNMTWSATKITTWGIIGDATPGDWGSSTAMTLNSNGTYTLTANLIGGKELKFRANNDWAINFGDNKANNGPDGVPDYGGDNIAIASSGSYVITLDLTLAGNYSYTIRKQ
jgi:hypothetical protein